MAKKQNRSIGHTVSLILLVFLLIGVLGAVIYLTRGCSEELKSFALKIENRYIFRDESNFLIENDDEIMVFSQHDYRVCVYAYADECDFTFTVDDTPMRWSDYSNLELLTYHTSGLSLTVTDDGFRFNFESLQKIISNVGDVVISSPVHGDIFRMDVTSNGCTISVTFSINVNSGIDEIQLDRSQILF